MRRGDAWGGYPSGEPVDETTTTENVANLNWEVLAQSTSPFSAMRYDEVLFLLAEAAQRGVIAGVGAEEYYEAAIRASIGYWHGVDTSGAELPESVIEAYLQNVAYDGTLRCIIEQKYIALFWCGMEAWNEYRRTGYPELTIGSATTRPYSAHAFRISGQHLHDQSGELCTGSRASGRVVARRRRQHAHARVVEFAGGATIPKTLKR